MNKYHKKLSKFEKNLRYAKTILSKQFEQTEIKDNYSIGLVNGMEWIMAAIENRSPKIILTETSEKDSIVELYQQLNIVSAQRKIYEDMLKIERQEVYFLHKENEKLKKLLEGK